MDPVDFFLLALLIVLSYFAGRSERAPVKAMKKLSVRFRRKYHDDQQPRTAECQGFQVQWMDTRMQDKWQLAKEFPAQTEYQEMTDYARERFVCFRIVAIYSEEISSARNPNAC